MVDDTTRNSSPFAPAPGVIIVTPYELKAPAGIVVDQGLAKQDLAGVVVAVGIDSVTMYGAEMKNPGVQLGDVIIHKTYYTAPYPHEGKYYRFISFADYVATLKQQGS